MNTHHKEEKQAVEGEASSSPSLALEIISPEGVVVSKPVWQVLVPGAEGEFGVRSGHMSLLSALRAGLVRFAEQQGGAVESLFVSGGFADVTASRCVILAEVAIDAKSIDMAALDKEISVIGARLAQAGEVANTAKDQRDLSFAQDKKRAALAARSLSS